MRDFVLGFQPTDGALIFKSADSRKCRLIPPATRTFVGARYASVAAIAAPNKPAEKTSEFQDTRTNHRSQKKSHVTLLSNPYSSSTYRQDFKAGTVDIAGPPETATSIGTLKCGGGTMHDKSVYSLEYVPWPEEDVKLFRSAPKNHGDDTTASEDARDQKKNLFDALELKSEVVQRLRNYYCPPHCLGNEAPKRSCLSAYKDKFNLCPPVKKSKSPIRKPLQPFSKFTNYLLDYIPHKIEPRVTRVSKSQPTPTPEVATGFSDTTTHKNDYICWSPDDYTKSSHDNKNRMPADDSGQGTTMKLGNGEPVDQSSSMMDYRDPLVTTRPTRGRWRDQFRPPGGRMDSETTTGLAFRKWEAVPLKLMSKPSEEPGHTTSKNDPRCFVTTYQQDFDDLREVLCPAKVIEKYGRKIMEPKYRHVGTDNEHEYYRFEKGTI